MQRNLLTYSDQNIIASDAPKASQVPISDADGNYNLMGMLAPTGPVSAGNLTLTPVTIATVGTFDIGTYSYVRLNATAGNQVPTLPPAATVSGLTYELFRTDATGNTTVPTAQSGELINGSNTYTGLTTQYSHVKFRSNGTGWDITG